MKFTKGYWMNRPGVEVSSTVQVREVKKEGERVYLYTVPYSADSRAMGGPVIELYLSSPLPDIIRVQAYHFIGAVQRGPVFPLHTEAFPLGVRETDTDVTVTSGETSLVVHKNPCGFTWYFRGKKLTSVGDRFGTAMLGYLTTPEGPFMRAQLDLDIGEKVYGLGERFTPFVRNGQTVDIWNEDGGTCTEISYKNIPFYVTNRGYGVFVCDPGPVSYEICTEYVTRVQFSVPGEALDFMVIGGGDMEHVLENYTNLTGRPALPPAWSMGLWLTSSFTTSYDEETVMRFVDGMAERKIPLRVFHFDCYWMKENEWCGFAWDERMFPDIEGMLSRMKNEKHLKICIWINPYIGQKSEAFREAMASGYLLKKPNGDVWQTDLWQAGMGIVDFTNPGAWRWYQDKLRTLLRQGVDCFKTDFGERIPAENVAWYDGSDPERMHNYYTYLYNKCVYELLTEERGEGEAVLFARSATAGGQQFPVHWGGDCSSNYPSMAESLRGGLSLCLSGFGFWSHDISGFEGTAPADVYKRWSAFGLLSTHSRLHGSGSYRVPWLFSKEGEEHGEESVAVLKYFSELKCTLMPYLYTAAAEAHRLGHPVMRPMVYAFPGDLCCEDIERQYMLGVSLMVAPVFSKDGETDFYLPRGTWTHFLTGEVREGGTWQRDTYDFFSLPLFAKENSIIPVGADAAQPDYEYGHGLTLHVFALKTHAETTVVNTEGKDILTVRAERDGQRLTFVWNGKGISSLGLLLRNIPAVSGFTGADSAETTPQGVLLHLPDGDAGTVTVTL